MCKSIEGVDCLDSTSCFGAFALRGALLLTTPRRRTILCFVGPGGEGDAGSDESENKTREVAHRPSLSNSVWKYLAINSHLTEDPKNVL